MIRDHTAVNELALALLKKLNAQPQDNFLSSNCQRRDAAGCGNEQAERRAFDKRYAENELGYHKAVNDLVRTAFIPTSRMRGQGAVQAGAGNLQVP